MTFLTETQEDALSEVVNIGFSRTAASLSDLTGHRVLLQVPSVSILPIGELQGSLGEFVQGEIATVHQIFTGSVFGDAILTDEKADAGQMYESDREVLTEVGNILLNACLGSFGNILDVQITFAVPRLHLEDLSSLLDTLVIGKDEIQYALVIYTNFEIKGSEISGVLVIVLGVNSLERLLAAVESLG